MPNLLQRALSSRRAQSLPTEWDLASMLTNRSSRPINGEYEVTTSNLDEIAEKVYKTSGPVWALIAVRMLLFSEARFQWQRLTNGRPGDLFGTADLALLETPWPGGTTGDLLARMEQDVSLMGNAFVTTAGQNGQRLRRLRPDWVYGVYGSESDPDLYGDAIDGELLAWVYLPRMTGAFGQEKNATRGLEILEPHEVAHYAPYPDPQQYHRGMSWLTPVLREVSTDNDALVHKQSFFRNGASPRLAMKIDPSVTKESFEKLVAAMEAAHSGPWNAYKTLYVGGGADPIPLTFNLKDTDFQGVTGAGESRLAAAAGVPPTIVGFSEGLAGSALNAGNYQQTKRRMGDATLRPLWRNAAGSFQTLFPPPAGARLWYDDRDIAFLRDDSADAAEIAQKKAFTIRQLTDAGFRPDAAIAAANSGDFSLLTGQHSGLFSVQLQKPSDGQTQQPATPAEGQAP